MLIMILLFSDLHTMLFLNIEFPHCVVEGYYCGRTHCRENENTVTQPYVMQLFCGLAFDVASGSVSSFVSSLSVTYTRKSLSHVVRLFCVYGTFGCSEQSKLIWMNIKYVHCNRLS